MFRFYLKNTAYINNWDLVDLTAPNIVGAFLYDNEAEIDKLYKMAGSESLWQRRISIVATHYFIRHKKFENTLKLSRVLINDSHDLIHKAVGWMLREMGKRDENVLKRFLAEHYKKMPRTMLRYSIEKFPEVLRQKYLKSLI